MKHLTINLKQPLTMVGIVITAFGLTSGCNPQPTVVLHGRSSVSAERLAVAWGEKSGTSTDCRLPQPTTKMTLSPIGRSMRDPPCVDRLSVSIPDVSAQPTDYRSDQTTAQIS